MPLCYCHVVLTNNTIILSLTISFPLHEHLVKIKNIPATCGDLAVQSPITPAAKLHTPNYKTGQLRVITRLSDQFAEFDHIHTHTLCYKIYNFNSCKEEN